MIPEVSLKSLTFSQHFRGNVKFIQELFGLSPWNFSSWRIVKEIQNVAVPPNNEWRMTILVKLWDETRQNSALFEDTSRLTEMIDSLCNS